jgi:hypothetical protein
MDWIDCGRAAHRRRQAREDVGSRHRVALCEGLNAALTHLDLKALDGSGGVNQPPGNHHPVGWQPDTPIDADEYRPATPSAEVKTEALADREGCERRFGCLGVRDRLILLERQRPRLVSRLSGDVIRQLREAISAPSSWRVAAT